MSNEITRKMVVETTTGEEISGGAIAKARHLFQRETGDSPDTLALNSRAYQNLFMKIEPQYINFKTFMGMDIYMDADLGEGEWRVRKTDSKTYAIKDVAA